MMRRRAGGRGETIRNSGALLDAMGRCRKAVLEAQATVKPFGVLFHGCGMVTAAIDALAYLITGQPYFYSVGGSIPPAGPPGGEGLYRPPDPEL